jgi:HK97 family phage major capsid protein
MITYLKRLLDERDKLTATQTALSDKAATEGVDLSETERATLATIQTRCAELDAQITVFNEQAESQRAYAKIRAAAETNSEPVVIEQRAADSAVQSGAAQVEDRQSWMSPFLRSAELANYSGHGQSGRVECGSLIQTRAAGPIMTSTFPSGVIQPTRWTGNMQTDFQITPLLDICGKAPVDAGAVDYLYVSPAPATAAPEVAEGALKPEADLSIELISATLKTYAHWKAATRQALDDLSTLQQLLENWLQAGVQMAVEGGIVAALAADANIDAVAGPSMLAAARIGMATVQANHRQPNGIVLNPLDWADIDLDVLAASVAGPAVNTNPFGLRIVAAPDLPQGTGYVGDFQNGVTVFDRGVSNVYATDSHADFFLKNTIVVLAETRALPVVTDTPSLVKISATEAVAGASASGSSGSGSGGGGK